MPTPKPTPKPPSNAAKGLAEIARSFDANLTDKNIDDIAGGIDYNLTLGKRINPKGRALKNWDEPATPFSVPE